MATASLTPPLRPSRTVASISTSLTALALTAALAACGGGGGGGGGSDDSRLSDQAPLFISQPPTSVVAGDPFAYRVLVTGRPAAVVAATKLPSWLTFTAATGLLAGTPKAADAGEHDVELKAANGVQPDATQAFKVTVLLAPAFTSLAPTTARVGVAYTYAPTTIGNPTPSIAATGPGGAALPGWLSFDANARRLSGTPTAADVGDHEVVLTAANGIGVDAEQSFTINVSAAPTFTSAPITTGLQAAPYAYTAIAVGAPTPTLAAPTLPGWLTFDAGTGLLSGTPGLGDIGPNPVVLSAVNGTLPDATQSFSIQVAAGRAPTFTTTAVTDVLAGDPYTYDVGIDANPPAALTATSAGGGALPTWLAFDGSTGQLSGSPTTTDAGPMRSSSGPRTASRPMPRRRSRSRCGSRRPSRARTRPRRPRASRSRTCSPRTGSRRPRSPSAASRAGSRSMGRRRSPARRPASTWGAAP